jgi:GTP-binding protein Era
LKSGFVNIFGKPNAGKSTFLNAMIGEKLAIVSSKVQTTRHRIKGILTGDGYQVIISDTPGIIEPKYKLHEKMMSAVRNALQDADLALLIVDVNEPLEEANTIFEALRLKVAAVVVLNKIDQAKKEKIEAAGEFFKNKKYCKEIIAVSALKGIDHDGFMKVILKYLPVGEPFFEGDEMTDLPTRFFVGEIVREKIFNLFKDEIPYHTTVVVKEFKEKSTLIKISADIIVQRETQKGILLGQGGQMIRQLGTEARIDIEKFLNQKVFLELFVKVRPKWRDNDFMLKEYGYY